MSDYEEGSGMKCCAGCSCMKGESCSCSGGDMEKPTESKDALLAQLKDMLNDNRPNGMADRQMKIDELMSKISDMKEGY
jgi:hypothetical protein